jgi:hypothetical protein
MVFGVCQAMFVWDSRGSDRVFAAQIRSLSQIEALFIDIKSLGLVISQNTAIGGLGEQLTL